MNDDYRKGFEEGWKSGIEYASTFNPVSSAYRPMREGETMPFPKNRPKRKVKQTPKQKLLTQMTKKKWDKYKKGRGKKTYVEIRAEVSRSQAYKKACKRL